MPEPTRSVVCERPNCRIIFEAPISWLKRGRGRFCSPTCARQSPFTPAQRFWAKVTKTDDCWLWTGGLHPKGYGTFGLKESRILAHRMSWILHYGPIPKGQSVLHSCDNPPCVRPDHLWLGTSAQNSADMASKGRSTIGVRNPCAKLTEDTVHKIRHLYDTGTRVATLARQFNVNHRTIGAIVYRQNWRHI